MAKAITYNNAGVVEAIKRNSGSTKFYPASFQGIIQALDDWEGGGSSGGGGGTSVLPEGDSLPNVGNTEGDLVVIPNGNGDYFMYVFANGQWERLHVTTEDVETAGSAPFEVITDDGVTLKHQADINAYLDERITALSEKGYDDTGIKADLAKEITDRTEGDQALQDQIDALEAYDDSAITGRVDNLEAAVEDLPTWIAEAAPEDKEDGDLWFDSGATGQLYVRYGGEWVVACPPVTDEELAGTVSEVEAVAQAALNKANILEWSLHQQGELVKWDQERQDGMILTLEEEIEQLKPSIERGVWNYNGEDSFTAAGNFILIQEFLEEEAQEQMCNDAYAKCQSENTPGSPEYTQCNRDYDTCRNAIDGSKWLLTNQWDKAESIGIAYEDGLGTEHSFDDIEKDMIMDVFNVNDDGYMVATITSITKGDDGVGIEYKVLQSRGEANGPVSMKFFHVNTEIDSEELTNFVRKTGDTITGGLRLYPESTSNPLTINSLDEGSDRAIVVNVRGKTREDGKRGSIFTVVADGSVNIDDDVPITSKWQVPHKKYVDEKIAEAVGSGMPIGSIVFWGGTEAKIPEGWVECKGQNAPADVKAVTGMDKIPNLNDYMPAGHNGVFGGTIGLYKSSRTKAHYHYWNAPQDRDGWPDGSSATNGGDKVNYQYWRGGKGGTVQERTETRGDSVTAPPCYIGIYIMKVK